MATVAQLAARRARLLEDLAKINEEITRRAGETDQKEEVPDVPSRSRR